MTDTHTHKTNSPEPRRDDESEHPYTGDKKHVELSELEAGRGHLELKEQKKTMKK